MNVQQIRFSNGVEVLANVISWEDEELMEANLILEIEKKEDLSFDLEDTKSYYILKPWISYTDDLHKTTVINPVSIMSVTIPGETVVGQYTTSIEEILKYMVNEVPAESESVPEKGFGGNVFVFTPKSRPQLLTEY